MPHNKNCDAASTKQKCLGLSSHVVKTNLVTRTKSFTTFNVPSGLSTIFATTAKQRCRRRTNLVGLRSHRTQFEDRFGLGPPALTIISPRLVIDTSFLMAFSLCLTTGPEGPYCPLMVMYGGLECNFGFWT